MLLSHILVHEETDQDRYHDVGAWFLSLLSWALITEDRNPLEKHSSIQSFKARRVAKKKQ